MPKVDSEGARWALNGRKFHNWGATTEKAVLWVTVSQFSLDDWIIRSASTAKHGCTERKIAVKGGPANILFPGHVGFYVFTSTQHHELGMENVGQPV